MVTYKNNGGSHTTETGVIVPNGGTFESDIPDLCKKFPNKFTVLKKAEAVAPVTVVEVGEIQSVKTEVQAAAEKGFSGVSDVQDVTSEFATAAEAGLTIKRDPRGWHVYDGEEPLNEKPLKKREVKLFLAEYLED